MIIPTLTGFVAGEKVTGAKLTLHTKTAFDFATGRPFCSLSGTGTTLPAATTLLTFPTIVEDNDGMADTANNRIVIKTAGIYRLHSNVSLALNGSGYRILHLNAGAGPTPPAVLLHSVAPISTTTFNADGSRYIRLAVNDVVNASLETGIATSSGNQYLDAEWVGK